MDESPSQIRNPKSQIGLLPPRRLPLEGLQIIVTTARSPLLAKGNNILGSNAGVLSLGQAGILLGLLFLFFLIIGAVWLSRNMKRDGTTGQFEPHAFNVCGNAPGVGEIARNEFIDTFGPTTGPTVVPKTKPLGLMFRQFEVSSNSEVFGFGAVQFMSTEHMRELKVVGPRVIRRNADNLFLEPIGIGSIIRKNFHINSHVFSNNVSSVDNPQQECRLLPTVEIYGCDAIDVQARTIRGSELFFGKSQSVMRDVSLLGGINLGSGDLPLQQFDLFFGRISFLPIRNPGTYSTGSSNTNKYQRSDLNPIFEYRLRVLSGVLFLLFGVWLIYYADWIINDYSRWRRWLLRLLAIGLFPVSFILLLYRGSLLDLWNLL